MESVNATAATDPAPVASHRGFARSSVGVAAIAIGASVIVLAVLVAAILVTRPAATYPADSPEAAFQSYLATYRQGDLEAAYAAFSSDARRSMTSLQYESMAAEQRRWGPQDDPRIVLDRTDRGDAGHVTLRLTIEHFSPGLFDSSRWSEPRSIRMVREAGRWRIDDLLLGLDPAPYMGP